MYSRKDPGQRAAFGSPGVGGRESGVGGRRPTTNTSAGSRSSSGHLPCVDRCSASARRVPKPAPQAAQRWRGGRTLRKSATAASRAASAASLRTLSSAAASTASRQHLRRDLRKGPPHFVGVTGLARSASPATSASHATAASTRTTSSRRARRNFGGGAAA